MITIMIAWIDAKYKKNFELVYLGALFLDTGIIMDIVRIIRGCN